jgi:tripartite-type tricarboxylate transporter receptor subunit TctC
MNVGYYARGLAVAALAAGAGLAALLPAASAQEKWPSRRITLVVPFGAGSVTDAVARIIADQYKDILGQPIIVESRGGAGGTIGANSVARAAPDGYTLLMGGNTTHSAAPALFKKLPYNPVSDFTPVARLGKFTSFIAANMQQPFSSIQELIAFAKANPGKLSYGHGNSTGQIVGETLKKRLGIEMARVSYTTNAKAMTDLLGNNIQVMVPDFLNGVPHWQAGKVKSLAVVMLARSPIMPKVPTIDETVIKGFEVLPWVGVFGPAKLPPDIVTRLSDGLKTILSKADVADKITKMGCEPYYMASTEFPAFVKSDIPTWAAHAKVAGIEAR